MLFSTSTLLLDLAVILVSPLLLILDFPLISTLAFAAPTPTIAPTELLVRSALGTSGRLTSPCFSWSFCSVFPFLVPLLSDGFSSLPISVLLSTTCASLGAAFSSASLLPLSWRGLDRLISVSVSACMLTFCFSPDSARICALSSVTVAFVRAADTRRFPVPPFPSSVVSALLIAEIFTSPAVAVIAESFTVTVASALTPLICDPSDTSPTRLNVSEAVPTRPSKAASLSPSDAAFNTSFASFSTDTPSSATDL